MILVIGSALDITASLLVDRFSGGAVLLTSLDLSTEGTSFSFHQYEAGTLAVQGRQIPARAISGVVTLTPGFYPQELIQINAADREYVCREMNSFMIWFLSRLRCPMLNRPSVNSFSGPSWRPELWFGMARRAGIPCVPLKRENAKEPEAKPDDTMETANVTVIGREFAGAKNEGLRRYSARLARDSRSGLLTVAFAKRGSSFEFQAASPFPNLSDEESSGRGSEVLRRTLTAMILLWGLIEDPPTRMVYDQLKKMDAPVFFLNHRDIDETRVSLACADALRGTIRVYGEELAMEAITSGYFRTHNLFDYPTNEGLSILDESIGPMVIAEDILWSWAEATGALVVNKPSAMASNDSKSFQAEIIQSAGFSIPETLITTSPSEVTAFWEKHHEIIYKSNSSVRSIVRKFSPADRNRLNDVRNCPTMFQEYISGTDYRVHVVGGESYACKIHSPAEDYRYADSDLEVINLPQLIQDKCVALAAGMGLHVAGIDLRQHSNGTWYCFEVNPSPGFSFFEAKTGLPIANSIARLLMRGSTRI